MSEKLTIGKLASATGTKVETIRYYEQIGLLPAPARSAGNYRTYEGEHLRRLSFIRKRPVETVVGNGQFRDAGGGTGMTDCGWQGEWRLSRIHRRPQRLAYPLLICHLSPCRSRPAKPPNGR